MAFVKTSVGNLFRNNTSVPGSNDMDKITLSELKTQVKMGSKSGHTNSQAIPANITFNKNNSTNQVFMLQPFLLTRQGEGRLVQTQYQIVQQGALNTSDFTLQSQPINILGTAPIATLTNQNLENVVAINNSCLVQLNSLYTESPNKSRSDLGLVTPTSLARIALPLSEMNDGLFASTASVPQQQFGIGTTSAGSTVNLSTSTSSLPGAAPFDSREDSRHRCDQCGQEFEKWSKFQRHLKRHDEESLYRCEECHLTFTVQYNLTLHAAIHNKQCLECPECNKTFSRLASLKSHILLHFKEETFPCHICLEEFPNQTQLDRHQRSHHNLSNTSLLSKPSSGLPRINTTATTLNDQGQTGSGRESNQIFSSAKVYSCVHCKASFQKVLSLKEHMKLHNKFKQSLAHRKYKRFIDRSGFAHACDYCNKNFQKPSQLERHLRIHTGERPYKCDSCDKAFNQKGALVIHLYRHTGNRPFTCSFCPSTFSQRGNLRAHIQRVHSVVKEESCFKCLYCSCAFKKLGSLNAHISRCHGDSKGVLLNLIDPQTGFLKSMLTSKDSTNEDQVVNSNNNNNNSDDQDNPNNNNNSDVQEFQLSINQEHISDSIPSATSHENNSNINNLINDIVANDDNLVNENFMNSTPEVNQLMKEEGELSSTIMHDSTTGALEEHYVRKVNGVKWHQCNYCSKEFKKPSDLIRHVRVHTRERPYSCPHCDRSFSVKSTLTTHIRTHSGAREFKCNICFKWFASNSSLHTHTRLHTGLRPFKCRSCDRQFRTSGHRASHEKSFHDRDAVLDKKAEGLQTHTNSVQRTKKLDANSNGEVLDVPHVVLQEPITITEQGTLQTDANRSRGDLSNNRPYVCQYCNHAFKKSSHLKQHVRSHTGEKPYTCTICSKGFVSGGVLKAHLKTHEGVKEHKCDHCHHAFTTVGSMKRHMATHSEKRDFICPYCQKAFKTRVNCKKHIKTHRQEVALQSMNLNRPIVERHRLDDDPIQNDSDLVHNLTDMEGNVAQLNLIEVSPEFVKTLQQVVSASHSGDLILQQIQVQENDVNNRCQTQQQNVVGDFTTIHRGHASSLLSQHGENLGDVMQTDEDVAWTAGMPHEVEGQDPLEGRQEAEMAYHQWRDEVCTDLSSFQQHLINQNELTGEAQSFKVSEDHNKQDVKQEQHDNCLLKQIESVPFHSCEICSATFNSSRSLKRHMTIHRNCRSTATDKDAQTTTSRTINQPPYTCPNCLLTFRSSTRLIMHLQIQHPTDKQPEGFNLLTNEDESTGMEGTAVDSMVEDFTAGDGAVNALPSALSDEDKLSLTLSEQILFEVKQEGSKFQCDAASGELPTTGQTAPRHSSSARKGNKSDVRQTNRCLSCDKTFKKPSDLVRHVRIHTGEKPYACCHCNRRFTVKSTLDSHLNTHNPGEKKFQCHVCNSSFSTKGSLKVHMRLHTGSRPFKCLYCDQRFRTSGHRKSHMSHHLQTMVSPSASSNLVIDLPSASPAQRRQKKSIPETAPESQPDELAAEDFENENDKMRMVISGNSLVLGDQADNVLMFAGEGGAEEGLAGTDVADETFYDPQAVAAQSSSVNQVPLTFDFANSSGFSIAITDSNGNSEIVEGEAALQLLQSYFSIDSSQNIQQQDGDQQVQQHVLLQPQNFILQQSSFTEDFLTVPDQCPTSSNSALHLLPSPSVSSRVCIGNDGTEPLARRKDSVVASLKKKALSNKKGKQKSSERRNRKKVGDSTKQNKSTPSKSTDKNGTSKLVVSNLGQQNVEQQFNLQLLDDILKQHQQPTNNSNASNNSEDNGSNVFSSSDLLASADGDHSDGGLSTSGVDAVFLDQGYLILQPDLSENFMASSDNFITSGVVSSDRRPSSTSSALLQPMEMSLDRDKLHPRNSSTSIIAPSRVAGMDSTTISLPHDFMFDNSISQVVLLSGNKDGARQQTLRFATVPQVGDARDTTTSVNENSTTGLSVEAIHKCLECNKTFKKRSQMERHQRIHTGEKPYACSECKKQFNQMNALKVHQLKHQGIRPHSCSVCSQTFTQKGNLKTHMQRAHKDLESRDVKP